MATKSKVTSKRNVNETTGVITIEYSDGRKTIDTPNKEKGGFDRVQTAPGKETVKTYLPPKFKPGGNAVEPLGVAYIPKGTPVNAIGSMLTDCIAQIEKSRPGVKVATVGAVTVKLF